MLKNCFRIFAVICFGRAKCSKNCFRIFVVICFGRAKCSKIVLEFLLCFALEEQNAQKLF